MVDRRNTPDILAALGALPKAGILPGSKTGLDSSIHQSYDEAVAASPEYLEDMLARAAQALVAVGGVLGRRRLIRWLDEIRDTIVVHREQETTVRLSESDVAAWLTKYLGAITTTPHHSSAGRIVDRPYEVDIWARFEGSQARIDMWVECRNQKSPIKRRDVLSLVRKAVDVFYAAHAEKKDFWFDRLMLISSTPFDPKAIQAASRYGVTCVLYDGGGYMFQACEDWQQKPEWLVKAEATLEELQG